MEAAEFREGIAKIPTGKNAWIRDEDGRIAGSVFRSSEVLSNGLSLYLFQVGGLRTWFTGVTQGMADEGELDLYCKELRMATVNKSHIVTLEVEE